MNPTYEGLLCAPHDVRPTEAELLARLAPHGLPPTPTNSRCWMHPAGPMHEQHVLRGHPGAQQVRTWRHTRGLSHAPPSGSPEEGGPGRRPDSEAPRPPPPPPPPAPRSPAEGERRHQLLGPRGRHQQDGLGGRAPPLVLLAGPQELHGRVHVARQAGLGRGGGRGRGLGAGLPHLGGHAARRVGGEAAERVHEDGGAGRAAGGRAAVVPGLRRGAPRALRRGSGQRGERGPGAGVPPLGTGRRRAGGRTGRGRVAAQAAVLSEAGSR